MLYNAVLSPLFHSFASFYIEGGIIKYVGRRRSDGAGALDDTVPTKKAVASTSYDPAGENISFAAQKGKGVFPDILAFGCPKDVWRSLGDPHPGSPERKFCAQLVLFTVTTEPRGL